MSQTIELEHAGAPAGAGALASRQLKVLAPLSGQVWPLERVPDAVFAQKMVGDGLSIDPVDSVLVAPCDGKVVSLHAAGHAVTLRPRRPRDRPGRQLFGRQGWPVLDVTDQAIEETAAKVIEALGLTSGPPTKDAGTDLP